MGSTVIYNFPPYDHLLTVPLFIPFPGKNNFFYRICNFHFSECFFLNLSLNYTLFIMNDHDNCLFCYLRECVNALYIQINMYLFIMIECLCSFSMIDNVSYIAIYLILLYSGIRCICSGNHHISPHN